MSGSSLARHGDVEERQRWPAVRGHFPLYEIIWQMHVVTLRDGTGHIRQDVDERLELLAQAHYKCFLSVSIALAGLGDEGHPERTFSSLQNAANQAQQVIEGFNAIRSECVPLAGYAVDRGGLAAFARSIRHYRNFVHEDVIGMLEHQGQRFLPHPDRLDKYARWSRFRNADLADFVPLNDYIRQQFDALCRLLADAWQEMRARSPEVIRSPRYAELLPPLQPAPVMQEIVLCSNVQLR
jgi:hypothetical protein